jgi:hypothetical protein
MGRKYYVFRKLDSTITVLGKPQNLAFCVDSDEIREDISLRSQACPLDTPDRHSLLSFCLTVPV